MQYAVVVLDHIAQGFHVALDEAGDDLAFEAAVFVLLDDPLAGSSGCLLAAPSAFAPLASRGGDVADRLPPHAAAEFEPHDNRPSMELIDFGLNTAPRSLT